MADFELYVVPEKYEAEMSSLEQRISKLQALADQYAGKKEEARKVWGDQDENLAKALKMCDTAIAVVNQKIEAARGSYNTLREVYSTATDTQSNIGGRLDDAEAQIRQLLK